MAANTITMQIHFNHHDQRQLRLVENFARFMQNALKAVALQLTVGLTVSTSEGCSIFISNVRGEDSFNKIKQWCADNKLHHRIELFQEPAPQSRMISHQPNLQQIAKKGNTMSTPITITTKTLINDQDAARYPDAELYELIRREEVKIEELNRIKNKPKKLVAEIEARTAGIQKLVDFMDSRTEKPAT